MCQCRKCVYMLFMKKGIHTLEYIYIYMCVCGPFIFDFILFVVIVIVEVVYDANVNMTILEMSSTHQ